jgi:hypothetical protein
VIVIAKKNKEEPVEKDGKLHVWMIWDEDPKTKKKKTPLAWIPISKVRDPITTKKDLPDTQGWTVRKMNWKGEIDRWVLVRKIGDKIERKLAFDKRFSKRIDRDDLYDDYWRTKSKQKLRSEGLSNEEIDKYLKLKKRAKAIDKSIQAKKEIAKMPKGGWRESHGKNLNRIDIGKGGKSDKFQDSPIKPTPPRSRKKLNGYKKTLIKNKKILKAKYGKNNVWDIDELRKEFKIESSLKPYTFVTRKKDGKKGSVMFSGRPRLYYNFNKTS